MKKKLISLLFAVLLTVGVFPGITAAADETDEYQLPYYATALLDQKQLAEYTEIRNAVIAGKSSYTFAESVRTKDAAKKLVANAQIYTQLLLYYDTYTFNLKKYKQVNVNNPASQQLKLEFEYYYTQKSYKTIISRLDAVWEKVEAAFTSKTSDVQKIKYINDYIAKKCTYDLEAKNNDLAYGALYLGKAKCDGYSFAFQYLAEKAGFDVVIALDDGTDANPGHAWNKIKVGKSWYNIDVTNNDYTEEAGYVFYDYFMLADSEYTAAEEWDDPYIKEVRATNTKNSYHEMYKLTAATADDALAIFKSIGKTKKKTDAPYLMTYQITSKDEYAKLKTFLKSKKNSFKDKFGINFSATSDSYFADDSRIVTVIIR